MGCTICPYDQRVFLNRNLQFLNHSGVIHFIIFYPLLSKHKDTRTASPQAMSVLEMFISVPAKIAQFLYKSTRRANFCCRLMVKLHRCFQKKKYHKQQNPALPFPNSLLASFLKQKAEERSICMKVSVSLHGRSLLPPLWTTGRKPQ